MYASALIHFTPIAPARAHRTPSRTVARRGFGTDNGSGGGGHDGHHGGGHGGKGGGGGGGNEDDENEDGYTDGHWSAPSDTMTVIVGATVLTRARTALTRGAFGHSKKRR